VHIFGTRWTKREAAIVLTVAGGMIYWVVYSYFSSPFSVFLSYIAVVVAVVAALAASISLKYTRDTIRPFLSFDGTIKLGGSHEEKTLAFKITNTGSTPADDIKVIIDAFGIGEEIDLKNVSNVSKRYDKFLNEESAERQAALILFPNQSWQSVVEVNLTRENNRELWESLLSGSIKLRITIWYRSFGRKHKTIQTLAFDTLSLSSDTKQFHGISVEPQKWV